MAQVDVQHLHAISFGLSYLGETHHGKCTLADPRFSADNDGLSTRHHFQQLLRCGVSIQAHRASAIALSDLGLHGITRLLTKAVESLPALLVPPHRGVEERMRGALNHRQVYTCGLRRIVARKGNKMISKLRRNGQVSTLYYCSEAVDHSSPVSFVGRLKPRHEHIELRKQSPCVLSDSFRIRARHATIEECIRYELL